jgi:hypothetical protein
VISASKEIEPDVRAMLLHAQGLFRLDIVLRQDTLRIIVRNLSSGPMETSSPLGGYPGEHVVFGEALAYEPSHASVEFKLGEAGDRVSVSVDIGTLKLHDRGTIRVSAQAIVREAPHSAS